MTYKLFRLKSGKLYPLFVECSRGMAMGVWLDAGIGELVDETHVRSRLGSLALRPGFHSTEVPFTDWIGKRQGSRLVQRKGTAWCECEVEGREQVVTDRHGLKTLPSDWYYFRTKPNQPFPWIISNRIKINRILSHAEVEAICSAHGVRAQDMEE
ncbi:MAG: hypothetical protein Q4F25_05320 [Eubacteriales bacterium]|nr:hypothetical protein [Eubacteriales bacterium]